MKRIIITIALISNVSHAAVSAWVEECMLPQEGETQGASLSDCLELEKEHKQFEAAVLEDQNIPHTNKGEQE